MNEFWAFEDWPTARARVHRGGCRFCNHGIGLHGGGNGKNCEWHGPYASEEQIAYDT
jgi:hypothetical protein